MKNLKKLLPISLACTMALNLVACGSDDEPAPTVTYTAPVTTTTTTPVTPTPEPVVDVVSSATPDFVTLSTPTPSGELTEVTVPHFPDKIVFLDYMAFDMCATWGVIDALEYMTIQAEMPEELSTFVAEGTVDLSASISKGDLSLIEEFAPDVIFSTQDLGHLYDELSAIAPTVSYEMDESVGLFQNLVDISKRNSTIFSVHYLIDPALADFETRLETLKLYSEQVTAVVLKDDGNTVAPVVDNDEYPLFFKDLGFVNLAEDFDTTTEITYDVLSTLNPDYIFTMDLASTVATPVTLEEVSEILEETEADSEKTEEISDETAENSEEIEKTAETEEVAEETEETNEVAEETEAPEETETPTSETAVTSNNKLLEELDSWENGKVVALDAGYWHTVAGGVFAMDTILFELESAFGLTAENRLVCYRDTQAYEDYWAEKAAKQAAKEAEAAALAAELGLVIEEVDETEETTSDKEESATTSDSDKEEAATTSDSDKEEAATTSDSDKEEAATTTDSDKEEAATTTDSDKEEAVTTTDSDKEETTSTSTTTDYESLEGKITDLEAKIADLESRIEKLLED